MVQLGESALHTLQLRSASLLDAIAEFCRKNAMAESTFGRRAVNDGKFVSRLRDGARITPETLERVSAFMGKHGAVAPAVPVELRPLLRVEPRSAPATGAVEPGFPGRKFRFFDNRQKYLLFVNTCSEKEVVARRAGMELAAVEARPPALRLFDAGMGDGTLLTRVMREAHRRFPIMPHLVVGKEISPEDVRLSLDKMPDRFFEHPATVLVITNMYYTEAPWLQPRAAAAEPVSWREVALTGATSNEFSEQISALEPFLAQHWQAGVSPNSGRPVYERPAVLVIYREDYRVLLDEVVPSRGKAKADYDLVIASQPYRLRAPLEFKSANVIAPLVRALGPGGRLIGIHSHGADPGLEIIRKVWPSENPYLHDRHDIMRAVRGVLGRDARRYNFNAYADARAVFRYEMRILPGEIAPSVGTSTLFAAWNAASYVNQIDDERLATAMGERAYLDGTREVLQAHGGLWFQDETFVISRKRD